MLEIAHRSGTGKGVVTLNDVRNSNALDIKGVVYVGNGDIGFGIEWQK